ncbi:DNA-3-methyladenine glycosylase [Psychrilyobacter atlanticus]|uniref:DNA-3-methyladenine glycosylase n=1 Tax=Psychrilyobacter atlanticus TaxID=271091 RepID=UPI00042320DF|nr:DNA-3-methyladenine glycosylase [Psychrilyobacter atlanticus]
MKKVMVLNKNFYIWDGHSVARELLGKILVKKTEKNIMRGRIVETETYLAPKDRASHAYNNRLTKRTKAMFMKGGHSYVYHGIYTCFNVVANHKGIPHAVLIRALEPLDGIEFMYENRNPKTNRELLNGPRKLCQAFNISINDNACDLTTQENLWIEDDGYKPKFIVECRRIGIEYAKEYKEKLWRFYIKNNNFISRK